ncbi:alkaline phosphatase D family protein [Actinacidiphila sp. bgisy167]|uniref:alkaline phosphatase D family protein n=1 Tax=Actinacidiphila sp. bgisy167 TaxID=3413797 RepID=UPI003D717B9C
MTHPRAHGRHDRALRTAAAHFDRRRFLTLTGAAAALAFSTNMPVAGAAQKPEALPGMIAEYPFTLGVASGDPTPSGVVLWTRLAPRPYEPAPGNGLPDARVLVLWEIARDERFLQLVRIGATWAHPEFNHTVHVDAQGLEPDRVYYYRFRTGPWISPPGRTRTAPEQGALPNEMRLAAVSCQAYHDGYFTALGHLAHEDVDAVFHLGDYLYEYAVSPTGGARAYTDRTLPSWFNKETVTLEDYRLRYALYRSDPDLQAAHAAFPWFVTWDDHETENNYAGASDENGSPADGFLLRRAAAYRAYWENQPLRLPQLPQGPDMTLYRRFHYGRLAQFDILDTRQYRTDQAHRGRWHVPGPEVRDPAHTMLGATQERWLLDGFRGSRATWNVVPQQVVLSRRRNTATAASPLSMDAWDGYPDCRERVLAGASAAGVRNLMVLTGDVHVHNAMDIKADWDEPTSRTIGTELVTSSLTSGRNGSPRPRNWQALMDANPHLRFYDGRRGYVTVRLDSEEARADFKTVDSVTAPGAALATAASFVTVAGDPGLRAV